MRSLPDVVTDILTHHGAAIEQCGENRMEFLVPKPLSRTLDIPEYGKLDFASGLSGEEAIPASYDSELLKSMEKLFLRQGRLLSAAYPSNDLNIEKISRKIMAKTALANATWRLDKTEHKEVAYLLLYFRYVALSDERKEGLLSLMINELTLSATPGAKDGDRIWEALREAETEPEQFKSKETMAALQAACTAATHMTKEKLSDFIKSLERRLNLDIKKGYEYYETLKEETRRVINKKGLAEGGGAEKEVAKLREKLEAISAEQQWKIKDLISKYALEIQIEPVSAIRIQTETPVFWINLKRRLATRQIPLAYNPLTKQIDPLVCEACFYPRGAYYICDDKLHITCAACFPTCPRCGKQYCPLCHKHGCPKCGR